MELDHDTPGYLYEALAKALTARIESGELAPNTPLPAEVQLAREYNVSLGTARHATRVLRERGLVVTVKSKGTYVAKREREPPICLWSVA
ncbi:GntR family transcriptional regulator [Amycolatopsis alkalitolerans]|uniref:Winged helix-turn-helix transcriptional regulator n=1 Tax=Amycolatopsis alkalitolerans TaxID=2547244 RepID=A0A5C4LRW7_9PSEU|nr:winged helix-turn-helix domain-containing protein [Amycolatopsis alkalitolerans]TNC18844.1 winged helix-turn-helix transcriptional regulator [Amycolatopsis alkalitolerans]